MRYDVLLFDADNTIFDFDACERIALTYALNHHGITPTDSIIAGYHSINARYWHLLSLNKVTKSDLYVLRFVDLLSELGSTVDPSALNDTYREALGRQHVLLEGAAELLRSLSRHHAIYVATNGHYATQRSRITDSGIDRYLRGVFISDEIGYEKPDKRFFDFIATHIPDFDIRRTIMIGDSIDTDVRGAVEYGMDSLWFCPCPTDAAPAFSPTFTARSFADVDTILNK